jgi:hypothetical protein
MIEKKLTLPCGHVLEISQREHSTILRVIVSTDRAPENLGVWISRDGQSARFYVHQDGLPVLRDLLIELAPLPSPATIFRENVIKIFKFLKGETK